ncbi:hypothetical protein GP486_004947 [Trichoglossum hirsutum]|uniref:Sterol 3-beta-glucosyltransferase n=1 Tax=Trichoglossum hirsutum TaxID=265104 RepID=A0A9P8RNQ5_9PEZI|nr:hypothetical protein GP486_004947 [Trichoglossum hirsutum]
MHPEDKKVGRKLAKKRKDHSRPLFDVPERFKDGDDASEDVSAPKGQNVQYMNHSVFSMIAAAGSKADFNSRFDSDSSEGEDDEPPTGAQQGLQEPARGTGDDDRLSGTHTGKHRRKISEHRLFRSLPRLGAKVGKEKSYVPENECGTQEETVPSETGAPAAVTPRQVPIMSRLLEAEAQAQLSSSDRGNKLQRPDELEPVEHCEAQRPATNLSTRLMEIFEYAEPEDVISEYPCWLLNSILLQGYMYITTKHVCFYAYLPKKSPLIQTQHIVAKSGYLSKRGRQNPKFNRYWFVLKGDVLSYYMDPSDVYFPSGNIDLRYAYAASHSDKGKDTTSFHVATDKRKYYFKADSVTSAKEWVKSLQKVIFRSRNDGDSVKISLPIENIIDVEESPVIEFAETFKIRVYDNDETFAMDEYFFSFFSFGKDAFNVLRILVDDTPAQRIPRGELDSADDMDKTKGNIPKEGPIPTLRENVRATLAPPSPTGSGRCSPRPSGEVLRSSFDCGYRHSVDMNRDSCRSSFERGRRSGSNSRKSRSRDRLGGSSPLTSKPQGSSDSFVHSLDPEPGSAGAIHSGDGTQASASQILNRSDVFQSPTIQRLQMSESGIRQDPDSQKARSHSEENKRSRQDMDARAYPPSASQTQRTSNAAPRRQAGDGTSESDSGADANRGGFRGSSSPTLQEIVKAGSYPLQRAAGFAGYLKDHSKRMSSLLATESMGYFEKVSGMWTGGRRHYDEPIGLMPNDDLGDPEDEEDIAEHGDRFRNHFALREVEKLQATYFGFLHRVLPLYGKIYISNRSFCFRSLLPGTRTKDVENVDKEKGFRFGYSGLVIVIRGHEELFFEFSQPDVRDDCVVTLLQSLDQVKFLKESGLLTQEEREGAEAAKAEHRMLQEARHDGHSAHDPLLQKSGNDADNPLEAPPILFDDPRASILNFKPAEPLRITCLTIGSRGDVQPYIALCKGLLAEGHKPKIATHAEYKPWIEKHGIQFAQVEGDPAELMRICIENGMFTYSFIKEASLKFRGWLDDLLISAWAACQDSDVLIESPSAMAGIHIAEALGIPYFRAFTMPWTRTRAYPHAFAVPEHKMGGAYNYFTYVMFDNVFWKAIAGQINRWRKKELALPRTNLDKLQPNKVPFLYNFSPSVVVPPLDYSDWIRVTGYWFLDEADGWDPPKELTDFIKQAREDRKKIVYVGFGSIVVSDPAAMTRTVIDSVLKADVRCILSKGWSDRLSNKDASEPEVPLPKEILQIKSAPHDWLFKQVDAAAHHGGAGTTGASLRAGLPTIIKPFFGDQFFFGSRIEDMGVGIFIKKLNVSAFSRALWSATNDERMIVKAKVLGEQIRSEDGVEAAVKAIYRDLEYAKSLIKKRGVDPEDAQDDSEESWTFIGDEGDPELQRRIADWEPMNYMSQGEYGRWRNKLGHEHSNAAPV